MFRALHVALLFLTTLPLPPVTEWQENDARRGVRAYPVVGLLLGVLLLGAWWLFSPFPEPVRGALLLGAWLLLTGTLHFDGFCDLADAAFASKAPEECQRIAKDPHIGVFALAAGGTLLLVKAAALGASKPVLLLIVPTLSRTLVVLPMALNRVHSSSRLGRSAHLNPQEARLPLVLGAGLCAGVALLTAQLAAFLWLAATALGTVLGLAWWLQRQLDGLGGDAYGATIETSEAVMLTLASAL